MKVRTPYMAPICDCLLHEIRLYGVYGVGIYALCHIACPLLLCPENFITFFTCVFYLCFVEFPSLVIALAAQIFASVYTIAV